MKMRLHKLTLVCKKSVIEIKFDDFTYLYGEMGAGKSTIARLVDYCFGGSLDRTPALQSEFVSVILDLKINDIELTIERPDQANSVIASWGDGEFAEQLSIPARKPKGILIPETEVEVLSDLIFHLAGITPPKVRKSRLNEDSDLERLSFRDLWWYCFLDQETLDSNFFHLNPDSDTYKRLKSRTVLGFLLGYNQQKVAELESELNGVRSKRHSLEQASHTMTDSLRNAGFDTEVEIDIRIQALGQELKKTDSQILGLRNTVDKQKGHSTDQLAVKARQLGHELVSIGDVKRQVKDTISQYQRHLNEMLALGTKLKRVVGARAVLNGLEFECCPRCAQPLPDQPLGHCSLCGQVDPDHQVNEIEVTDQDISSRQKELNEMIIERKMQLRSLDNRELVLKAKKEEVDKQYAAEMKRYDTWYLSQALAQEKRKASVEEETRYLLKLKELRKHVASLANRAKDLRVQETTIRAELKEVRAAAEKDATNLEELKKLFLDCLLRARIKGFREDDTVTLHPSSLLPEVSGIGTGDIAVTSFSTLGSGGKKTLFKCCFAIAVHRLVNKISGILPTVLIIDTPMKNISERENQDQFESFHQMLYELADGELAGTQFVLIDKEYSVPTNEHQFSLTSRHMTVDSDDDPPLIPYYRERTGETGSSEQGLENDAIEDVDEDDDLD